MSKNFKLENIKPQSRTLKEIQSVLFDQKWAEKTPPDLKLYDVYRGLKRISDMRYDLTFIPPQKLGREFARTKGNQNSDNLPELYHVLEGEAIFLLQKSKEKEVEDIFAVRAKKNDFIHISGDYAVVIINPTDKMLKTANWVSEKNQNIYEELEKMGGMGYFYTLSGWVKNPNYEKVPQIKFRAALKKPPAEWDFLKE